MLVITRKIDDIILIGEDIQIMILSIQGKHVRLGIKADKSIVIKRSEYIEKDKFQKVDSNSYNKKDKS